MNNTTTNIIEKSLEFVKGKFENELPEFYRYHNFSHTQRVIAAAKRIAEFAKLNEGDSEVLQLAAIFHDIGYVKDPDYHEEAGSKIAREFLIANNYPEDKIKPIEELILSTKLEAIAGSQMQKYIKDADLSGLSDTDYNEASENLRLELNSRFEVAISKKNWLKQNIKFLQDHDYCTEVGLKLFEEGKEKNLELLKKKKEGKKKSKGPELLTIGSSKSAQTQLKTALRNHIDLSSIADNKANIMLSVNAIVITVGLPLILERLATNEKLIIPAIILALASLVSMIFATLSTRPAKMFGTTSMEQINAKKSNLFFFGNFYRMSFEEYEEGMHTVVGDNEILDNSITRDLFFLGKSLGKKYEYLRWCYSIFMYGIAAAIIAYMLTYLF